MREELDLHSYAYSCIFRVTVLCGLNDYGVRKERCLQNLAPLKNLHGSVRIRFFGQRSRDYSPS
ncbi:hypothetical protein BS78_09G119500 [Paspalum vaginatum]|nr:hypothetical protein BS78_09G119500 [Paspalum vaginatum]